MSGVKVLASNWNLIELPHLRGSVLEWVDRRQMVISRGSRLLHSETLGRSFREVANFPLSFIKSLASTSPAFRRVTRSLYYNVIPMANNLFLVSFDRTVGLLGPDSFQKIPGIPSTRILRNGIANLDGRYYFGQYTTNSERSPIHIFSLEFDQGLIRAEIIFTFEANEVRHIHRIAVDPYTSDLWCLTGDLERECKILKSSDNFRTLQVVGEGNESWRSISPIFTSKFIYYATDSEYELNAIYRIDRQTLRREKLANLDGPVYYSTRIGNDLFFAVTAEACPSQDSPCASLWHLTQNQPSSPEKLLSLQKDILPAKLFLPGTINFPSGAGTTDGSLYFSTVGLKGADFKVFRLFRTR